MEYLMLVKQNKVLTSEYLITLKKIRNFYLIYSAVDIFAV